MDMREWPNAITMSEEELFTSLRATSKVDRFPRLMVMERLFTDPGAPDTADLYEGDHFSFAFTKVRANCREGLHTYHLCVPDEQMLDDATCVSRALGLRHFVNVQFMNGKLLEVNPRISTQFVTDTYNMPAAGVAAALNILGPDDFSRVAQMPTGARMQYYWRGRTF